MTDNDNELLAILQNYPRLPHEQQELILVLTRWRDEAVVAELERYKDKTLHRKYRIGDKVGHYRILENKGKLTKNGKDSVLVVECLFCQSVLNKQARNFEQDHRNCSIQAIKARNGGDV